MADPSDEPVDYATLAEFMAALGTPVRLELLKVLRFAHTLSEIKLRPARRRGGLSPDRTLARQTVQEHLDRLVEKGMVNVTMTEQGGREVPLYTVNPTRLYALIEDLRSLSTVYAGHGSGASVTAIVQDPVAAESVDGPRLVLVHGVYEGKAFPLERATADRGADGWLIGRDEAASVSLDYDPYVSRSHARIVRDRRRFILEDLDSKNQTRVNWTPVPAGGCREIVPGDVVGVGRSLLVFARDY